MADKDDEEPEEGDEEGGETKPADPGSKKKLLLIVGIVLLAAIGGIGGAFYAGLFDSLLGPVKTETAGEEKKDAPVAPGGTGVYLDVPEIIVNLNAPTSAPAAGPGAAQRRGGFLKIRVSLELQKPEDGKALELVMPRIVDSVQVYLRELRIEDLRGSAGLYRLREELLMRVANAAQPTKVNDVLFKEMLIQ